MKKTTATADRREARAWMILNNIRQKDIMKALGYRYSAQVNETLQGKRNNRRVLQYLLDNGCPARALQAPADMSKVA